jgi:hypothetical protein
MGNTNVVDNDEEWDYSSKFPNVPVNVESTDNKVPEDISKGIHPYLRYQAYVWLKLMTSDNKWSIAGLFPRNIMKKIAKINPNYQIEGKEYPFNTLCNVVINDTYKIYQKIKECGESVLDLVPFQYRYTKEEMLEERRDTIECIMGINDRLNKLRAYESYDHPVIQEVNSKLSGLGLRFNDLH